MYWYKVDQKTGKLTLVAKGVRERGDYVRTWTLLKLSNVRQKDAGTYMCRKNNSVGAVANASIQVLVKGKKTTPVTNYVTSCCDVNACNI